MNYGELQPDNTDFNLDMLGLQSTYESLYKAWLQDKPQQAFQDLLDLGQYVYQQGKTKISDFIRTMKEYLGEMWEKFKPYIIDVWQETKRLMKSEEGAVINPFYKLTPREQEIANYISEKGLTPTEEQYAKFQEKNKLSDKSMERIKNAVGRTGVKGYNTGKTEAIKEEVEEKNEKAKAEIEPDSTSDTKIKKTLMSIIPTFIDNYLDELSKKLNPSQKIIIGIMVAAILFVITMAIADKIGTSCTVTRLKLY